MEFFKSLSAIGDTLNDNRIRNSRASVLAGMSDSTDPADYDVAARRLIAQGDLQGGVSLAGLWQKLAQLKQAQDHAAMIMTLRQAGAWPEAEANTVPQRSPQLSSDARLFNAPFSASGIELPSIQLAAMDETERKRLLGNKPEAGGGAGGDSSIYRAGGSNPGNLTLRPGEEGLSFRDSLSNPYPKGDRPVFRPSHEYIEVDPSRLPPGSVIPDNVPPGHVTVKPTPLGELIKAIIMKGRLPR